VVSRRYPAVDRREPRQPSRCSSGTILLAEQKVIAVIDDDLGILLSLELMLLSCGYHGELFASADDFLNAAPTLQAA
jgi:hypothetical protein